MLLPLRYPVDNASKPNGNPLETQYISYLSTEATLVDIQFPGNEITMSFLRGPVLRTSKNQTNHMYAHDPFYCMLMI